MSNEENEDLRELDEVSTVETEPEEDEDGIPKRLDFDEVEDIEIPVTVKGKHYVLKEASGKAATEYRNALMACITLGPEGKAQKLVNLASVEPLLVSSCLFYGEGWDKQKKGKNVPKDVIQSWPSRVQKKLFETVKDISDIAEESNEKQLLERALKRFDSPISIKDLRGYVETLDKEEFKGLQRWLKPSEDETAKNDPSDTMAG